MLLFLLAPSASKGKKMTVLQLSFNSKTLVSVGHNQTNLKHHGLTSWISPNEPSPSTGLSDIPGEAMVKLYCPKCMDVYTPKSSRHHHTDGAYFGTGFPHMLFMVHPEYRPKRPANQFVPRSVPSLFFPAMFIHMTEAMTSFWKADPRVSCHTRLYGFKIHPMAYQLQLQAASSFKSPVKAIR